MGGCVALILTGNYRGVTRVYPQLKHAGGSPAPHWIVRLFGDLEIYAAVFIGFAGRLDVKPGHGELGRPPLAENPESAADNGVVLHFLGVLVAEDQQGGSGDRGPAVRSSCRDVARFALLRFPLLPQTCYFIFQAINVLLLLHGVVLRGVIRGAVIVVRRVVIRCGVEIVAIVGRVSVVSQEARRKCREENAMTETAKAETRTAKSSEGSAGAE